MSVEGRSRGHLSPAASETDDALFAELYPRLRRFAAMVGSPQDDPDDLVQEAVVRALRRGPLHELTNPLAYLRSTIANLNLNRIRSKTRYGRAVVRLGRLDDLRSATYPSDLDDLMQLSPIDRAIVFCATVQKMPYRDIAELVSLSERATAKRADRALEYLRVALRKEEDHG
jgi:RNA polymerase sigma factor (sigma-70 family)